MKLIEAARSMGKHVFSTREAATILGRKPQTLRKWACSQTGPLRPVRIGGRLGWPVEEVAALAGQVMKDGD
ncbi:helix-turn-helix domain-containing protein [Chromobacterium vaccinii]|uniref:helix-turn-helix domain-containing protein n=1 Tax=Chromobacterium vaccinii TaxID=1108595 RepID=UPI0032605FB4